MWAFRAGGILAIRPAAGVMAADFTVKRVPARRSPLRPFSSYLLYSFVKFPIPNGMEGIHPSPFNGHFFSNTCYLIQKIFCLFSDSRDKPGNTTDRKAAFRGIRLLAISLDKAEAIHFLFAGRQR